MNATVQGSLTRIETKLSHLRKFEVKKVSHLEEKSRNLFHKFFVPSHGPSHSYSGELSFCGDLLEGMLHCLHYRKT